MFLPHPRVKVSIVGSLRDREVACSASDRQGSNFVSCVWRTVSSHSSHHPQEVLLAQFSLYLHKGGLKPDSFHFILGQNSALWYCVVNYQVALTVLDILDGEEVTFSSREIYFMYVITCMVRYVCMSSENDAYLYDSFGCLTIIYYCCICFFWMRHKLVVRFGCHYPMNLNSLGHCICVHQGHISAAAGREPGTPELKVNHATNEPYWRLNNIFLTRAAQLTLVSYVIVYYLLCNSV